MKNKIDIDLIIYDFDGVMTDNKVYIDEFGKEIVPKLKKTKDDYERSQEILESLGITESDREDIYDIIEGSIIDEE